jgi:hypothetical protein
VLYEDNVWEDKMKKLILMAIAKGVVHASIIPVIIFVLTNKFVDGNLGGIVAFVYMFIVGVLYNFVFQRKDISKKAFNMTFASVVFIPMGFMLLQALAYGVAG